MPYAAIHIDAGSVIARIDRISKNVPKAFADEAGFEIAEKYAECIRQMASKVFDYPSGELESSIRSSKQQISYGGESSYIVKMADYGWYVERGRKPGKMPPETGGVVSWVQRAWGPFGNTFWFRRSIAQYGTQPKSFIMPGIVNAQPEVKKILSKYIRPALK